MIYITKKDTTTQSLQAQISITDLFSQTNHLTPATLFTTKTFIMQAQDYWKTLYDKKYKTTITPTLTALSKTATKLFTDTTDMSSHYIPPFFIPKRNGKTRRIDAPNDILMDYLRKVKIFFEECCECLPHNGAHAYIKTRSPKTCAQQHNQHKFFLKLDLKDFFPSCTKELVKTQLLKLYPLNYSIQEYPDLWDNILNTAFLNNALPQGTPLSPPLTNFIMIPFDFHITHTLAKHGITYTRFADDMHLSSNKPINIDHTLRIIKDILKKNGYALNINKDKTRYGTNAGKNWMLGLMVNKDHCITVGHRRKKRFKAMLFNFIMDLTNNRQWDIIELQSLLGEYSFIHNIEPNTTEAIITFYNNKYNINIIDTLKTLIRTK